MKSTSQLRTLILGTAAIIAAVVSPLGVAQDLTDGAFGTLDLMPTGEMDALRGRNGDMFTNVQSIQDLDATVTGGTFSAHTMTTGAVTIEQHAFDGFSGVGIFNLMSGNNNAVDAAVGISVFIAE